jgi:peptide chain release factor 1
LAARKQPSRSLFDFTGTARYSEYGNSKNVCTLLLGCPSSVLRHRGALSTSAGFSPSQFFSRIFAICEEGSEHSMSTLYEKLKQVEARYDEMSEQLSSPEVLADSARIQKLAKNHSDLAEIVAKYRKWKKIEQGLREAKQMANDADDLEMRQMAHEEEKQLTTQLTAVEEELKVLLLPRDPLDEKNVILEIRAGTGGDEAGLFAGELFRMYSRYAETQGWKVEVLESSPTSLGGVKDITAAISGQKVYSKLKYESGVHRVQRVPATEQQGRIHTSAATVAVLPEADEIDIKIEAKDLRIDTFCSSGPGGQSVNTTYSAVRITHLPTGTVVSQQDEKSQIKNRAKAMRVLRARLYELESNKQHEQIASERRGQIGSGDRSEKIRTYNFPQNRITDHRVGVTLHQLGDAMDGKIGSLVDALVTHYQAERLKQELGSA